MMMSGCKRFYKQKVVLWQVILIDIKSIYAGSGDAVNQVAKWDSSIHGGNITVYDIESIWGDSIDWLTATARGNDIILVGEVPNGFNQGGGNVRFWDPNTGTSSVFKSDFFDINAPFTMEDSGSRQVEIGNQWTNSRMDTSVHVNTKSELNFNGQEVAGNAIKLSDGSVIPFDEFDQFRSGRGIEVAGSQFDDYIDLSGLSKTDFDELGWWQYTDFELTPGNDYWHAPEFKVDGKFVGDLDARHFYDAFIPYNSSPGP